MALFVNNTLCRSRCQVGGRNRAIFVIRQRMVACTIDEEIDEGFSRFSVTQRDTMMNEGTGNVSGAAQLLTHTGRSGPKQSVKRA